VAASMPVVRFGGEGKRRGEWGVRRRFWERRGRRGGACAGWAGRRPRPSGEGGRWLGLGEGGGPREEEGEWAGGRSHRPGRNRCSG
jgi:hypothetical protein